VSLSELMKVSLMNEYSENEVLGEVQTSYSYRKTPRYQWERRPDGVYVRAAYGRKFERVESNLLRFKEIESFILESIS